MDEFNTQCLQDKKLLVNTDEGTAMKYTQGLRLATLKVENFVFATFSFKKNDFQSVSSLNIFLLT